MAENNRTIAPESTQGEDFKSLLQTATGKEYGDIGEADVERWASAQGWRGKDVKRIVKGFTKFSKRDNNFNLTTPGEFRVEGASGSGRRKGNRKGFDAGDLIGLGRDVSLLGGALETVQTGGGEEKVVNSPEGQVIGTPEPTITAPIEGAKEGELQNYTTRLPDADPVTASGAGVTQAAGQTNQQVQKDRSSKSIQVPEGAGDIAFSPSEVFDRSPLLQRQGLGVLNNDPNDFGGNIRLGDAPVTGDAAATPSAKEVEQGINVYGFSNPIGKDADGYYEIQSTGKKKYISPDHKRYQHVKDTVEQGGERDIGSLMGRAAQHLGKVFEKYKEELGKTKARTPSEMFPYRRFGGKTKFSKNVSI